MSQDSVFGAVETDTYMKVEKAATGLTEYYHVRFSGEFDDDGEAIFVNDPITETEYEEANR